MYSIKRDGRNGRLSGPINAGLLNIARDLPGRKRWVGRDLVFELTAANIEDLKAKLPDAVWDLEMQHEAKRVEQVRIVEAVARELKKAELPPEAFQFAFKTTPFDHQRRAFFVSQDLLYYAYLMEMGTGKTKVMIDKIAYMWSKGVINAALIHAPNGVHEQWATEQLPMHMPTFVRYRVFVYDSQKFRTKKAQKEWADFLSFDGLRIMVMNIEAMSHPSGVEAARAFLMCTKPLWAIDESTRIKTPGATRTKNIHKLSSLAVARVIASGAPITKGVEDLYAQFKFLNPDILGFSSFYTFRNRYCVMGGYEGKMIVGYRNVDELLKRIDGHSFRVTKDQCLDLPPKVYTTRHVHLTADQRRLYVQMRDEFIAQLDTGKIVDAPLAITRLMKLQQIVCGFLKDEDGGVTEIDSERASVLGDIIEEAQGQVLVWARFHQDFAVIKQELFKRKIKFVEYHGKIGQDQRVENKDAFKTDPDIKVFLGNATSGGIGLNLANATTVVYYSNDFNADVRWQSEDRAHRFGQTKAVTYIDLVSPGTVDMKIVSALRRKKNVADSILDVREALSAEGEEQLAAGLSS